MPAKHLTQSRRWAVKEGPRKGQLSEFAITPQEARTALTALIAQRPGYELVWVHDYDTRQDRFYVESKDEDDVVHYEWVPGEHVGQTVMAMRHLAGTRGKPLMRPSEIRKMIEDSKDGFLGYIWG